MTDLDLDDLASELAEFDVPERQGSRPPHEERIIAGFEDIQRFVEQHGRVPEHGEERDIFERIYAVRLHRIRSIEECRVIVSPLDHQALLAGNFVSMSQPVETMDDDDLMAELEGMDETSEITKLRYVRTSAEKREAEEIANREKCKDFERFRPLFDGVAHDLTTGARISLAIRKEAGFLKSDIKAGEFFVLFGQTVYVAEVGKKIRAPNGETDARLRVIYSNATESNLLLRSLQRALYKDDTSRKVSEPSLGPLFDSKIDEADLASGTVYVLRSKSEHPTVTAHREVVHKIGVTGGDVTRRITNARLDPTFLMAEVEIVATYELFNINRTRLENLIHRIFRDARLDIEITDRFGQQVIPREWFLVPLYVVDEAIEKIRAGTITEYVYDPRKASLVKSSLHLS
jgi:hypothetical protein